MALFGPRVGHEALFDEICRFISADRKTKTLLQSIIKQYHLAQPAKIFIEPDTLLQALSDPEFEEEHSELQKLYDAWFVEPTRGR